VLRVIIRFKKPISFVEIVLVNVFKGAFCFAPEEFTTFAHWQRHRRQRWI